MIPLSVDFSRLSLTRWRDEHTLLAVKRSGNVSQRFWQCPRDVREAIKEEKVVQLQKYLQLRIFRAIT
jgi:hypothetical protein